MSNSKIVCLLECLLPVTNCNFTCSYCYVSQNHENTGMVPDLKYDIPTISKALAPERWGGKLLINICGSGETLIPDYIVPLCSELLDLGHVVTITTNGTLSKRIDQFINFNNDVVERLHFTMSLHYLELKSRGLLSVFSNNYKKLRNKGISVTIKFNYSDVYEDYIDEIKEYCIQNFGANPQVAVTRDDSKRPHYVLLTNHSSEDYYKLGSNFNSPLWDFTFNNFNKKVKKFCYAGHWSFRLNLVSGTLSKCYANNVDFYNVFDDPSAPIPYKAVGRCNMAYCVNADLFHGFGVVPSIKAPTYYDIRNRQEANWYSKEIMDAFKTKLYNSNQKYSFFRKIRIKALDFLRSFIHKIEQN